MDPVDVDGAARQAQTSDVAFAPLRVVLADADPRVRSALRLLIEQELGATVCAETCSPDGLLEIVRAQAPDLLVVDWDLASSGRYGAAALVSSVCRCDRPPAILALGRDAGARRQALAAGVDRFVAKVQPPERVLRVLRYVSEQAARRGSPEGGRSCLS